MVANNGIKIGLKAYDDLFKTDEGRKAEEIIPVKLSPDFNSNKVRCVTILECCIHRYTYKLYMFG